MEERNFLLLIDPYMSIDAIMENIEKYQTRVIALYTFPTSELGIQYREKLEKVKFYKILHSYGDIEKDLNLIKETVGSLSNIVCGFVSCERSVIYGEKLLKKIFPSFANDPNTSYLRVGKIGMTEVVKKQHPEYSIPTVSFNKKDFIIKNDEIVNLGFPIVLKRDDLCGTVGLQFCSREKEMREYMKNLDSEAQYVVQKRIFGDEYNIDTFSFQKKHFIVSILRYNKIEHNGSALYNYMDLLYNVSKEGKQITQVCKNILNDLDVSYGLTNIEIFNSGDKFYFIELNNRIPGGNGLFTRVEKLAYGYSQLDFAYNYGSFLK